MGKWSEEAVLVNQNEQSYIYEEPVKRTRGTWRHLLVEGLGLVADAAVGSAVGATQRRGVPSKHPPQHRRHHHVHRKIAAHLRTITDTCSLTFHIIYIDTGTLITPLLCKSHWALGRN